MAEHIWVRKEKADLALAPLLSLTKALKIPAASVADKSDCRFTGQLPDANVFNCVSMIMAYLNRSKECLKPSDALSGLNLHQVCLLFIP